MNNVSLIKISPDYPKNQYFHPDQAYPEYPFANSLINTCGNLVYKGVRDSLYHLGLDKYKFDCKEWNPFGEIIKPGNTVLIKPNMVKESHLSKPDQYEHVITHGAVIRAVCDYVIIALGGNGNIIIADAPETDADFSLICKRNGLQQLLRFYNKNMPHIQFQVIDLRKEQWKKKDGVIVDKWPLPGDPMGYTIIRLNKDSEFIGHGLNNDYFGATFKKEETKKHHHGEIHEYLISSTVLACDVLINIPKLKTHKKSGLTCCLKNMVGVNGDKNWLPHHTEGTPIMGGDQFPNDNSKAKLEHIIFGWLKAKANKSQTAARFLAKFKKAGRFIFGSTEKVIRSGNWYGNDTVWRMILDLNKSVFHFDKNGNLRKNPRSMFCLVDGVLAGEGIGPMHPDCKKTGLLVAGLDPAAVDRVCAKIMGFDYLKIPSVNNAFTIDRLPITELDPEKVMVKSNIEGLNGEIRQIMFDPEWSFVPHFGWNGHIEL